MLERLKEIFDGGSFTETEHNEAEYEKAGASISAQSYTEGWDVQRIGDVQKEWVSAPGLGDICFAGICHGGCLIGDYGDESGDSKQEIPMGHQDSHLVYMIIDKTKGWHGLLLLGSTPSSPTPITDCSSVLNPRVSISGVDRR